MQINTNDYLSFTEAVELSKRAVPTFYEHVLRGNIQYIEMGRTRFYLKKDVLKLARKEKQPHQAKSDS